MTLTALAAVPAGGDVGPIPVAGELSVEAHPNGAGVFPPVRLGKAAEPHTFRLRNTQLVPVTIGDVVLEAPAGTSTAGAALLMAFSVASDCPGAILLPRTSCDVVVTFAPLRPGGNYATLRVYHDGRSRVFEQYLQGEGLLGLYVAGAFGEVVAYGDAKPRGDLSHVAITTPILGLGTTPSGEGYWLMEAGGRTHPFGDATDLGSPDLPDSEYAVALTPTPTGKGYWLATQAGGVYTAGDAGFFGAAAGTLAEDVEIVDMTASPSGKGYWLLDGGGGVYAFGDAAFFGSAASLPPRYPMSGLAPTATGKGYWLIDALGGVFPYGDADAYPADTRYSAYSLESALDDAVISIRPVPYGQGFVYGRLKGGFAAMGLPLTLSPASYGYGYGYGGDSFQQGSFAVDLALNVSALQPSPEAGTVVRRAEPGPRLPQAVCDPAPCVGPPASPEPPVPVTPGAPAPPAALLFGAAGSLRG